MFCYRHGKSETHVRCGKCDRPICGKCMVPGPAGMRCRECASLRGSSLYRIPPYRIILAIIGGIVVGLLGAYVISAVSFFTFFIGPFYGGVVAETVLRASGRKASPLVLWLAIGSILLGALIVYAPDLLVILHGKASLGAVGLSLIWAAVGFGLAISACWSRLKFF